MWEPILEGELADSARRCIVDLARTVATEHDPRGVADRALFWAYVAGAFEDDWIAAAYDAALGALADHAATRARDVSLHHGLAGTGFVVAHVSEPGSADDTLRAIDDVIASALAIEPWTGHFDLISGLTGVGVYLLERGPAARPLLDRLIAHLATLGHRLPDGVAWHTRFDQLPHQYHPRCPDGYFNVGVAHGTPGVMAMLGRCATLPDADPSVRALALDAIRWVRSTRDPERGFPAWVLPNSSVVEPARTAWCYGDPGVAIALWSTSARLGLPVDDAIAFARKRTAQPAADTGVVDAGICHGAAGLAHLYNRCFQASREPVFRDAARDWIRRALEMRGDDGGYLAWAMNPAGELEWRPMPTFLVGPMGIGLALLAAITDTEPSWDRLLLCDL